MSYASGPPMMLAGSAHHARLSTLFDLVRDSLLLPHLQRQRDRAKA